MSCRLWGDCPIDRAQTPNLSPLASAASSPLGDHRAAVGGRHGGGSCGLRGLDLRGLGSGYMAFVNDTSGIARIYIANADGSSRRQLTYGHQPDWQRPS
jgi:hypothetical protein